MRRIFSIIFRQAFFAQTSNFVANCARNACRQLIIFCFFIFCAGSAFACIDFNNGFATEVLITKPNVSYDVSRLPEVIDVKNKKIHFGSIEAMAYASHQNNNVAVIIAEDVMEEPLRSAATEDDPYPSRKIKGLDITIQIPSKMVEKPGYITFAEAVDVDAETFDFSNAMRIELLWLKENGIILGLSEKDIEDIAKKTLIRQAGKANRIVYYYNRWLPYADIKGAGMFIPKAQGLGGCGSESDELLEILGE